MDDYILGSTICWTTIVVVIIERVKRDRIRRRQLLHRIKAIVNRTATGCIRLFVRPRPRDTTRTILRYVRARFFLRSIARLRRRVTT